MRSLRLGVTLTMMMGIGPAIMFAMSALGPELIHTLHLSRIAFGSLSTVAYLAAAPGCLMAGRILSVVSARRLLLGCFGLAVAAFLLVGTARSMLGLVLAACLSGVIQSLSNPVTNQLVAATPDVARRGTITGVKQAGVQMGQLIAGLLPVVALVISWRLAVCLLVPVALLAIHLAATSVPARTERPARVRGGRLPAQAWWLFAYSFFVALAVMATNVYLPLFGVQAVGISSAAAGTTLVMAGVLGMLGRIGWGRAMDSLPRLDLALAVLALLSLLGSLTLLAAALSGAAWVMWSGVFLHGVGAIAANAVIVHALLTTLERHQLATASGLQALAQYLGFAVGPIAFGSLVETTDSYVWAWAAAGASYLVAVTIAVLVIGRNQGRASEN
jgi:predicted MFS family arabinose efflux permease